MQELLVDELVAGADAVGREAVSEVCRAILGTPPALATFGTLQALGPLRSLLAPFPTPFELLYRYAGCLVILHPDAQAHCNCPTPNFCCETIDRSTLPTSA